MKHDQQLVLGLKDDDFLHYCMNRRIFFTFLLAKSCESGIKLTYVYARGVREFWSELNANSNGVIEII